jgi:hypothetical protein
MTGTSIFDSQTGFSLTQAIKRALSIIEYLPTQQSRVILLYWRFLQSALETAVEDNADRNRDY